MLLNLFIKDFGIIEKADIDFGPGLNVLSGETGSGKSLIIDAIQVVSGGRAFAEYIRSGCDRSIIQLTADISSLSHMERLISDRGINSDSGGIIVMARELNRNGRSSCRINGQLTTLNIYRELGQALIDIQGQYDQQLLFSPDRHVQLLDLYGGKETAEALSRVKQLYNECAGIRTGIAHLQERSREWARRQDAINYQINDIEGVHPVPGEDVELLAEKKKLSNIEKLSTLLSESYSVMNGGSDESVLDLAGKALKNIDRAAELDESLLRARDLAAQGFFHLEESCRELAAYIDTLEFQPSRLEYIEARLDQLDRLKKKYGDTLESVLLYKIEIEKELMDMQHEDHRLEALKAELIEAEEKLAGQSSILSELRLMHAKKLEREIMSELFDLEMNGAQFIICFNDLETITENGKEKVEFYISANPGEPVKPLSRVASGGEASRILLAIKGILAELDYIPTLVFDEVDTGIGGTTIKSVAIKLKYLSSKRQVVCVTHSPQVASVADRHLSIRKIESEGRTTAGLVNLEYEERIDELARMLGGDGKEAMEHARKMLQNARNL